MGFYSCLRMLCSHTLMVSFFAAALFAEPTEQDLLAERLQKLIIPECKFTDAPVADILAYLEKVSAKLEPNKPRLKFVLKDYAHEMEKKPHPLLSMDLKNAPLTMILNYIERASYYKYQVKSDTILVSDAMLKCTSFLTRTFNIEGSTLGFPEHPAKAYAVENILIGLGAKFPEGSKAIYQPKNKTLIVRNTEDQLDLIEELIRESATDSTKRSR